MKKSYIQPAIKAHKLVIAKMIAGSNDPTVTSTQAESGSTGLVNEQGMDSWENEW